MPIVGLGLHFVVALFFAVHAVRTRQATYWLFILFSFPLLGSLVYFFSIYYPSNHRMQRHGRKMVAAAGQLLDPGRELREAQEAWDYAPTAQNRMRLAAAQLHAGEFAQAAQSYSECLHGPFATDVEMRMNAAKAFLLSGQPVPALEHLQSLQAEVSVGSVRAETIGILLAQAYAANHQPDAARTQFDALVTRYGSFQAYAEYAIWAAEQGDANTATQLRADLERITSQWSRAQRELNADTMQRLNAAYKTLEAPQP